MKFAHLADCHVGGWRDPKLRAANAAAFTIAIKTCLDERVDFVLIAGDLFNSAVPAIESLQQVVEELMRLKHAGIPVYAIAGSHDFSPGGRTMLDVLESAGLLRNVVRGNVVDEKLHLEFTIDPKTNVKIAGMLGKKGGLEKNYYHDMHTTHLEEAEGYKIFMFHTAIEELKPKGMELMEGMAASLLPKNFQYYAGGHVHVVDHASVSERHNIVYPGPVFPNNFSELEKLRHGSFCIVEEGSVKHLPLIPHPVVCIHIAADHKTTGQVEQDILEALDTQDVSNAIITLRVEGQLKNGRTTDIPWERIRTLVEQKGAYILLKNTNKLQTPEQVDTRVQNTSIEDIEQTIIQETPEPFTLHSLEKDRALVKTLMQGFQQEKQEGERIIDFETRVIHSADQVLEE